MRRLLSCILLLAVPWLFALGMAGQASARSGFIWIPHGGHVGLRGGFAGPRMGMPAARFGGFGGYAGPRVAPGLGGYRYGVLRGGAMAPRFSPAYGGARYGAFPRYGGYPRYAGYPRYGNRGWYGRYPYGGYYAGRYWRRHNGYWGGYPWYPWGIGVGVAGLGLWDWGWGNSGYYDTGYYDPGYVDNGYYTPVPGPGGGVGLHCQTPVRTCLLINPSDVGNGCSCRVPGGRARGVVIP